MSKSEHYLRRVVPFCVATHSEDIRYVTALLDAGADDLDTALGQASHDGLMDIVQTLLIRNANVNNSSFEGAAPLHHACARSTCSAELPAVVHLLLEALADPNHGDHAGRTCLHTLITNTRGNLVNDMIQLQEVVDLLLVARADVLKADDEGRTPLHCIWGKGRERDFWEQLFPSDRFESNITRLNFLIELAVALGLTNQTGIESMRSKIASGRFTVDFYISMWEERLNS